MLGCGLARGGTRLLWPRFLVGLPLIGLALLQLLRLLLVLVLHGGKCLITLIFLLGVARVILVLLLLEGSPLLFLAGLKVRLLPRCRLLCSTGGSGRDRRRLRQLTGMSRCNPCRMSRELIDSRGDRNRRLAMIYRGELRALRTGRRSLLVLCGSRRPMRGLHRLLLLEHWQGGETARSTDVAGVVHRYLGDVRCVDVANLHVGSVGNRAVVIKLIALPVAAFITAPRISEAVVHASVEANLGTPETGIPYIGAVAPCPVARSPYQTHRRMLYPGHGH